MTPEARFFASIRVTESGCWEWTKSRSRHGYGYFAFDGNRVSYAHRFAVIHIAGTPIPTGMHVDHLCRNPPCCNPDHLEVVTPGENTARGTAAARLAEMGRERRALATHCAHGHEWTPENTASVKGTPYRRCRTCDRERARRPTRRTVKEKP